MQQHLGGKKDGKMYKNLGTRSSP